MAAKVYELDPSDQPNLSRIMAAYREIGDIYQSEDKFELALKNYLLAIDWAKLGLRNANLADPSALRTEKCIYTIEAARRLDKSGNRNDASDYFNKGEKYCRQNLSDNSDENGTLVVQISLFYEIANFYARTGERSRAISMLLELANRMNHILEKNEWDFGTAFALADTFEKIGDLHTDAEAIEYYQKSDRIWTKYQQTYPLLPSEVERLVAARAKLT